MAEMPWFRFYSEAVTDVKFRRIARNLQSDPLTVIGAWVTLLSLASRSPIRGMLYVTDEEPYTKDDIADVLGWNEQDADMLVAEFIDLGMMEIDGNVLVISNWKKRQYESDNSTDRVKKYRDAKRYSNVSVTPPDTDTESDTESESEKELKTPRGGGEIFRLYEQNFGQLSPMIADQLKEIEKDYPQEWIPEAFRLSLANNKRRLSYAVGILKRWKVDGYKADTRQTQSKDEGYTNVTQQRLAKQNTVK